MDSEDVQGKYESNVMVKLIFDLVSYIECTTDSSVILLLYEIAIFVCKYSEKDLSLIFTEPR